VTPGPQFSLVSLSNAFIYRGAGCTQPKEEPRAKIHRSSAWSCHPISYSLPSAGYVICRLFSGCCTNVPCEKKLKSAFRSVYHFTHEFQQRVLSSCLPSCSSANEGWGSVMSRSFQLTRYNQWGRKQMNPRITSGVAGSRIKGKISLRDA